ncbi:heterokaryon incompatibility protein-domain-containing protein [Thelonectria olida]|uniref:Heterokaryon incompatibility protein-domain-containing protein n=1 Tax=Thelonectria olida TaxID=1576542 RepID=A0A9P9AHR4_9HYPO|nr:heterokaryon incompatibility protein-domain-containing protein [Thelonectria olida]
MANNEKGRASIGSSLVSTSKRAAKAILYPVATQILIIFIPYSLSVLVCYATVLKRYQATIRPIVTYFSPDFETAITGRYRRPVIGLTLCGRCHATKHERRGVRVPHYDNLEALEASALRGCWLCRTDRNSPPDIDISTVIGFRRHQLLMWFADWTETKEGFLDNLRGKSYVSYIYGDHPRELSPDFSSEACFDIVRGWTKTCDELHQCYQGQEARLPTRVIDAPYITLSHCWGGEQPLTATLSTIDERIAKIPMESLPNLYRDAVIITRRLNIKYLWIDSLCIIQAPDGDTNEDWAKESARMGDIYRCSYLTLFALDSENCHQGILVQRLATGSGSDANHSDRNTRLNRPRRGVEIFKSAPLCAMGVPTCSAREASLRLEIHEPTAYDYQLYKCPDDRTRLVLPLGPNPSYPISPASDWQVIISEYSRCNLTRPSDKLPALSGLASTFERSTLFTYLAGLWKEDFVNGLLWYVPVQEVEPHEQPLNPYRSPSWSWESTDLPICYKTLSKDQDFPHPSYSDLKLLDAYIERPGRNESGVIFRAAVTVRAFCQTTWYESKEDTRKCSIYNADGEKCGSAVLDAKDRDCGTPKKCTAVWVTERRVQYADGKVVGPASCWLYFLLVVPVPDSAFDNCWRRIGLGWTPRWRAIFDLRVSDIVFV